MITWTELTEWLPSFASRLNNGDSTMISDSQYGFFPLVLTTTTIFTVLVLHCYFALEKVQPTSEDLAKDIAKPPAWPLRAIGYLIDLLPFVLWDMSNANALLEEGANAAGLSVDDYSPLVVESIHKLCNSLKADSVKLNWAGRKNLHFIVTSGLTQYLLVHKEAKENPTIIKTRLNKPLIITGLPRSGTTHLHRLLSEATKESKPIPLWQHFFPVAPPALANILSIDLRGLFMQVNYYGWKFIANQYGMDAIHMIRPNLPDECHFSLRMAGGSFLPWNMAPVFDYCEWLLDRDASGAHVKHAYETYRLCLQLIQLENPNKRLVLKCPTHSYNLATLREVIPEAAVVITHRDPCKTTLSYCSMNVRTQVAGCKNVDWRKSIQMNMKKDAMASKALVAYCQGPGKSDSNVCHVSYKRLVSNPVQLIQEISSALQIPMEDVSNGSLEKFLAKNQQHAHGIHHYSLEGMELEGKTVSQAFATYKAFFLEYL